MDSCNHLFDDQSSKLLNVEINFVEIDDDLALFQEDDMVQQALQRGVDLKKYGNELENELRKAESDSVVQYSEHGKEVAELHTQMQTCDSVLSRMEEMLHGFQADLGEISAEIKNLQDDSLSKSIRLKNRRAAEEKIHKFLQNSSILPTMTSSITSPSVGESFLESVIILSNRLKYLEQTAPARDGSSLDIAPAETLYARSLLPDLENLKIKAISKIREYFTAQFNAIRKPKTNTQMLQQNSLVKYAKMFQFVQTEAPVVGDDLRSMYVESMGRTIFNLFKSYCSQLLKMDQIMASKSDLVVVEEATLKSMFSQKVDMTKRSDAFSLCDRDKILIQIEKEPLLVHVVLAENVKYPFEVLYRSIFKHLLDASTNEFLFIVDFFKTNPRDTFNRIFGRTMSLVLENLENYLLNCYDAVGLLIMIKMSHLLRLIMQRRRIPVLDAMFDRISMLLWPRFKQVLAANITSIKSANPKKLGTLDLTPHIIVRRYAELVASILTLQAGSDSWGVGGGGETMLQQDLHAMRTEIIALLERLAGLISQPKEKRVFFINNYDQILSVFQTKNIVCQEEQHFVELLSEQCAFYAEDEIMQSFPKLIKFVLQTEQSGAAAVVEESVVEALVREFASNWKAGISQINENVLLYFASRRNGMQILKQVLTQLLLYYTRFQEIIKRTWPRPLPFSREIVLTATILVEIKRYSQFG